MRPSIWAGILFVAIGVGVSALADALLTLPSFTAMQTTASVIAILFFVLTSAVLIGTGAALIVHWLFGFGNKGIAALIEIVLSFATFFVGIGAALMSKNIWTGLELFFTLATAGAALFFLSFVSIFGGVAQGLSRVRTYIKKRRR